MLTLRHLALNARFGVLQFQGIVPVLEVMEFLWCNATLHNRPLACGFFSSPPMTPPARGSPRPPPPPPNRTPPPPVPGPATTTLPSSSATIRTPPSYCC
mmetsp:Transcript_10185/g.23003  ORF Transcript_10185/g.23003 Transcript_10185/m.23003 type:complete len:99 (+) Transcript_10185:743-1039(+)